MSRRASVQVEAGQAGAPARARTGVRLALAGALAAVALVGTAHPVPESASAAPAAASAAAASIGWARMANTVFEHLGQHDGLPHAIATGVTEDAQGYLWASTQDGVARWDGYRFKVYPARPDDPHGLPVSYVRTVTSDTQGRIWVGMDGGGMARFEAASNDFTRFGGSTVLQLSPDAEGGMWGASTTGLMHVRASGKVEDAWPHGGKVDPLPEASITAVLQDRAGAVWVGTAYGLVERFPDGRPGRRIELPGNADGGAVPVDALYEDAHGQIWIGTNLRGVLVLDPATGRVSRLQPAGAADPGLLTDSATSFEENGSGEIWIGTSNRGLLIADLSSLQARRVMRDRSVPSNLQANWVWGLHRDRGGEMWVASTTGLSRTRPQQDAILSLFSSDGSSWTDPYVFAVDADSRGIVTLGQKSGIEVIDPIEQRMVEATGGAAEDSSHPPAITNVQAVVHTADGTRWMASRDGLFRMAAGSQKIERIQMRERGAVQAVTALLVDGSTLWVGGKGDGIWQLDLASPTHAMRQPVPTSALTDPEVTAIAPGPDGATWIATNNGLNLLRAGRPVRRIMPVANDPTSLAAAVINTLLTDRQGRLWVGNNAGVQILEKMEAGGRAVFHHIGKAEGLTSENIDTLLMDATGRVWISTDDGVAVVDPSTYALRVLHPADGAAISTYWVNSGVVGPTGELFFGGLGGLTVIRPERLTHRVYSAPLVVTDVETGGKPAALADAGGRKQLTVPAQASGFSVEFSLLDFTAPERNRYAYWLEGYDKSWREVDTTHRSASYTNLSPGHYVLHMKAASRDAAWTEHPLEVDVQILPAWYQTWWFDVLRVLAVLLVIATVAAVRVRYVQQRSKELARLVERRTQELTKLQHQLEELAYSDALTALPNRRMFGDYCRQMIAAAERQDAGFALLLIDLDHFKQVNDTLGHDAGDALLVETARRLRGIARKADVVARLGGDEFAILLADSGAPSAVDIVCKRICEAFDAPVPHQGHQMRISPSIGVALFPSDGTTQDALYKSADLALYDAKREGRDTWRFAQHKARAAVMRLGGAAHGATGTGTDGPAN
ncbi:MAG: diguanylate cyclase domain-containing protein [Vitreoscilla sp.]